MQSIQPIKPVKSITPIKFKSVKPVKSLQPINSNNFMSSVYKVPVNFKRPVIYKPISFRPPQIQTKLPSFEAQKKKIDKQVKPLTYYTTTITLPSQKPNQQPIIQPIDPYLNMTFPDIIETFKDMSPELNYEYVVFKGELYRVNQYEKDIFMSLLASCSTIEEANQKYKTAQALAREKYMPKQYYKGITKLDDKQLQFFKDILSKQPENLDLYNITEYYIPYKQEPLVSIRPPLNFSINDIENSNSGMAFTTLLKYYNIDPEKFPELEKLYLENVIKNLTSVMDEHFSGDDITKWKLSPNLGITMSGYMEYENSGNFKDLENAIKNIDLSKKLSLVGTLVNIITKVSSVLGIIGKVVGILGGIYNLISSSKKEKKIAEYHKNALSFIRITDENGNFIPFENLDDYAPIGPGAKEALNYFSSKTGIPAKDIFSQLQSIFAISEAQRMYQIYKVYTEAYASKDNVFNTYKNLYLTNK